MTAIKPLALAAVAILALAGCASSSSFADPPDSTGPAILATYGLSGLDGRQIVDQLDRTLVKERQAGLIASVRPGALLLSEVDSDGQTEVDLPAGEFYLSVAPYIEQTHDCYFHSLTTCRGELAGEPVHVTITDRASGQVLVDETSTTYDNGFVGFWLPGGVEATIQVAYGEYTGVGNISTGPEDPTCLTTVQLVRPS